MRRVYVSKPLIWAEMRLSASGLQKKFVLLWFLENWAEIPLHKAKMRLSAIDSQKNCVLMWLLENWAGVPLHKAKKAHYYLCFAGIYVLQLFLVIWAAFPLHKAKMAVLILQRYFVLAATCLGFYLPPSSAAAPLELWVLLPKPIPTVLLSIGWSDLSRIVFDDPDFDRFV